MPALRTFIDSGVLIAAVRGTEDVATRAFDVLDDPTRVFITSDFVRLEVLPKATFHRRDAEVRFYEAFFAAVTEIVPTSDRLVAAAHREACDAGLGAVDALHVAAARQAQATELVTIEKPSKPLFRVRELAVTTIHPKP